MDAVARPPRRPRVPKTDLSELRIASMAEVVRIEVSPSRVHAAEAITTAAGPEGVEEAVRRARRRLGK